MKKKPERKPWNPWTGGDLFYLEEPAIGPERSGGIDLEGAAEEEACAAIKAFLEENL